MAELLSKKEFVKHIIKNLEEEYHIFAKSGIFNNSSRTYTGIYLSKKNKINVSIVANADEYYEKFCNKQSDLEKLTKEIADVLLTKTETIDEKSLSWVNEWYLAKENIYMSLCCKEKKKYLSNVVFQEIEGTDLVFVPRILIKGFKDSCMSTPITKKLLICYNIDEKTIINTSMENSPKIQPAVITSVQQNMFTMMQQIYVEKIDFVKYFNTYGMRELFDMIPGNAVIVSSRQGAFGAAALFYEKTRERIEEMLGKRFYVIPANCNTMYVVSETGVKNAKCIDKRGIINTSELCSRLLILPVASKNHEKFLSDKAYFYNNGSFATIKTKC